MNREEFTSFYSATFHRLIGQVYAMIGDQAEAQDAVQEAFVRAWAQHHKLDADGAPESWIRVTAWRIAISRWRRSRDGSRLMRLAAPAESVGGPTPDRVDFVAALRKVPAEQRRALVLYHLSLADDGAQNARPLPTADVLRLGDRRRRCTMVQLSADGIVAASLVMTGVLVAGSVGSLGSAGPRSASGSTGGSAIMTGSVSSTEGTMTLTAVRDALVQITFGPNPGRSKLAVGSFGIPRQARRGPRLPRFDLGARPARAPRRQADRRRAGIRYARQSRPSQGRPAGSPAARREHGPDRGSRGDFAELGH